MNITKDTTEDDLLVPVRRAKDELHKATSAESRDSYDSERLADLVNNVATQEGKLSPRYDYLAALRQDALIDEIRRHLTRMVTNGPSDTYSGRRNDVRRAHFEGLCTAVAEILTELDRKARTTA